MTFQIQNNKTKTTFPDLKKSLVHFGLNPEDWKLEIEKELQFKIKSRHDQNFSFRGLAVRKKDQLQWDRVELYSL